MKTAAVLLALLVLAGAAPPQTPAPAQSEQADYESRLAQIRREIESLKSWLREDESKEQTTLSRLDRIGATKSLIRKELGLLAIQLDKNRSDLAAARKNIPSLQARLAQKREGLERVLVTLYKFGRLNFARFLIQAHDLRTLSEENKRLSVLASSQERLIADYGQDLASLGREAQTLESRETEINRLLVQTAAKKTELDREEEKIGTLVARIRADKKTHEQTLAELARRAEDLQALLQRLEKLQFTAPFPLTSLGELKGRVPWPTSGRKIVQGYGLQRHPQFNTLTMNNGIEIAPAAGDLAVRAVQGGRIAFADPLPGYGNLIIIDHSYGYHSLYGHCAEFLVKAGDFVRPDQPIAVAGDTGSLVGVSVYFEIRYQTKPVDPLQWLTRR
ncbi:MAG: peptidoglycan DD-metalloendopeptidase family protein [Candidatus Aminicenantales bacterium]|jgi:septal ring factor EnvC (AmiA/AmiB activator)